MPEAPKDAFLNDYAERNTTNVILSHMPLLFVPGSFVQNVCSTYRLYLYICTNTYNLHEFIYTLNVGLDTMKLGP